MIGLFVITTLIFAGCGSSGEDASEEMDQGLEEAYEEEYEDPMAYLRDEVIESEEMAGISGGIFVKSGEDYTACSPVNTKESIFYVSDPTGLVDGSCYVPTLDRSKDKLTVFSDRNMSTVDAIKVEDVGYTIPLLGWYAEYSLYSDDPSVTFKVADRAYEFAPEFYEDGMEESEDYEDYEDEEYGYEDEYESEDVEVQKRIDKATRHLETINGKAPLDIYNEGDVIKGEKQFEDRDWRDVLIPFDQGEEGTLGYRDGSAYEEIVLKAEAKGFKATENIGAVETVPEQASYISLDVSKLEAGTYIFEYFGHEYSGYYAVNIK